MAARWAPTTAQSAHGARPTPEYFYSAEVFSCIVDGRAIFCNLKTDQYLGLDGDHSLLFQRMLLNVRDAQTEALAEELIAKQLLSASADSGRPPAPVKIEQPRESLLDPVFDDPPRVTARHFAAFVAACVSVRIALRHRSTHHALRRFGALQARIGRRALPFDLQRAQTLARIFRHLRPIVYRAYDNCLYDLLVFGDFLRRHNVRSNCILGVRTMPFEAHCWLQTDGRVVNGVPELVNRFVPILVAIAGSIGLHVQIRGTRLECGVGGTIPSRRVIHPSHRR